MKKFKWMKAVVTVLLACCLAAPMQTMVHADEPERPKTAEEIAALEEIIQTYHNYVAKIVYSILSFYSTEIDIQAVINQVCFFALGKGRTDRYK